MHVTFVYPNTRTALLERLARGEAPDTSLLGQNHLHEHGVDATVHTPSLRRRDRRSGLRHRVTWHARELTLPWEVGATDVVCTPLAGLFPLAARLRRRPRVLLLSYHLCATYRRSPPARRRLLRTSIRSAAGVVGISQAARDCLLDLLDLDERKVHVAQLGVDERFWTPAPPSPGGYVLTVGRDLARDYATFAQALAGLPVHGVIVAKRENLVGVELPSNVEVRLDITPLEVRELYAGAACVVVPIRHERHVAGTENSGTISLLEAMASARPAVVSERTTLREYLRPGESALTVPPEEPAALRTALERLLADEDTQRSLGESARRAVEERFTTRAFAGRLAAILHGLGP